MRTILSRMWNSPTYTTWGSLLANSLSAVVVLPLVLTRFSEQEIIVWYLMATFLGLQHVVDIGFSPTFGRIIAYLMGGLGIDELRRPASSGSGTLHPEDLSRVYSTMSSIYLRLGLVWTLLLLAVGSSALRKPISQAQDPRPAWFAWGVILAVSYFSFWGEKYVSFLMGLNKVAILRRWDTMAALGSIATSFLVLYLGGGLLAFVVANQSWQIFRVIRNQYLARSALGGMLRAFSRGRFDRQIFESIWPSAWRSGVGVLFSYGIIQSSGIIYAQIGSPANVASYLLAMRFMQMITQFSSAPFYSKLPVFSRLYAEGKRKELLQAAQRGMRLSHWAFVVGFVGTAILVRPLLEQIGSNASFPSSLLWVIMGLAFFAERFGAMHIQLYSTTNHIVWHIANGVSGIIYLGVSFGLVRTIGAYAFPVGIIAGYYGFYSWYAARCSYREFDLKAMAYEKACSFAPGIALLASSAMILLNSIELPT